MFIRWAINMNNQEPIYMECGKCGEFRIVTPSCFLCADCFYKAMKEAQKEFKKTGELDSEGCLNES